MHITLIARPITSVRTGEDCMAVAGWTTNLAVRSSKFKTRITQHVVAGQGQVRFAVLGITQLTSAFRYSILPRRTSHVKAVAEQKPKKSVSISTEVWLQVC